MSGRLLMSRATVETPDGTLEGMIEARNGRARVARGRETLADRDDMVSATMVPGGRDWVVEFGDGTTWKVKRKPGGG